MVVYMLFCLLSSPPHPVISPLLLRVLGSSLLTRLQLIQVPATDVQVPLICVHAASELENLVLAYFWRVVGLAVRC
jgi:hypothetical protein